MRHVRSLVIAYLVVCGGCAARKDAEVRPEASGRHTLSHGYALIYERAQSLSNQRLLLYVKLESDRFERVIEDIAAFARKVSKDLEWIQSQYPAIRLDDTGVPEVEQKTRDAMGKDQQSRILPVVGISGRVFEREFLLKQLSTLEQQRHMAKTMIGMETSRERKRILGEVHRGYERLYREVRRILEDEHFCAGNQKVSTPEKSSATSTP